MKKILFLPILVFGIGNLYAQESTSIEAEGNLESLNPCGCVEISEVTNDQTPADIYVGIEMCIELKDFEKAAKLFAIAGSMANLILLE